MKTCWKQGVLQWRRENPYCQLGKQHFAPILENSIQSCETITNGFRACGLSPWNSNSIDFSKCLGKNISQAAPSSEKVSSKEKSIDFEKFTNFLNAKTIVELEKGIVDEEHGDNYPTPDNHSIDQEIDDTLIDIEISEFELNENYKLEYTEEEIL
ncbi:hypothetical protein HHI36_001634 [Cryptolaemus montrouzieri]|uniref:Uncharacterized protein n=1 Tax=Cryptolaemus montrouzieri TaxID=559131 RepID=A0ABD2P8H8_9CUCU